MSQLDLIDKGEWWEDMWQGMPEYISESFKPFKTIHVHFESREAIAAFSALVGQNLSIDTQWMWYPESENEDIGHQSSRCYDES